jgi:hypothetical protein
MTTNNNVWISPFSRSCIMIAVVGLAACGSTSPGGRAGAGGGPGGGAGSGGVPASGGVPGSGGLPGSGGGVGSGGRAGAGGTTLPGGAGGSGSGGAAGRDAGGTVGGGAGGTGVAGAAAGAGGTAAGGSGGRATGGNGAGGASQGGSGAGGATAIDAGTADGGPGDAALLACSQLTNESSCNMRGDCHAVLKQTGCELDAGHACVQFDHCADGGQTNCAGPASCTTVAPSCPANYAIGYAGGCYEGCVSQSKCPQPTCPATAPTAAAACGPVDYTCYYESCTTTGRTLATCSAGAWKLQTAACTDITCAGGGVTPGSLTCPAGEVCVVQTSIGGAYMVTPMCVAQTCGSGPISLQCVPSTYGTCTISYGLSGVVVRCSYSSCGSGMGGCA